MVRIKLDFIKTNILEESKYWNIQEEDSFLNTSKLDLNSSKNYQL